MTSRRLFLGAFTAGAVTVAAGAGEAAAAEGDGVVEGDTTFTGAVTARTFHTSSDALSSFTSTATVRERHALTLKQAGTVEGSVALNVTSENPNESAVWIAGREKARGTLKVTHKGQADGSDNYAAALSLDLQTEGVKDGSGGTRAQGIVLLATTGPTTGNLMLLRNNGVDDFVVKGSGAVGIGVPIGKKPDAQVHIDQRDEPIGLLMVGKAGSATRIAEFRDSAGVVQTRVLNSGTIAARKVQLGADAQQDFGDGGVLYAEAGELKWRGSNGTVTTIAKA